MADRIQPASIRSMTDPLAAAQVGRDKAIEAVRMILASLEKPIDPRASKDWGFAGDEVRNANELVSLANRMNGHEEG